MVVTWERMELVGAPQAGGGPRTPIPAHSPAFVGFSFVMDGLSPVQCACPSCVADAAPIVRTVVDWVPDRLLCKRWNVPDPYVGLAMQPQPGHRKSRFERESVADLVGLPPGMALPTAAPPQPGVPVPGPEDTTPVAPMARPAADLFRSIFDPSSDEED